MCRVFHGGGKIPDCEKERNKPPVMELRDLFKTAVDILNNIEVRGCIFVLGLKLMRSSKTKPSTRFGLKKKKRKRGGPNALDDQTSGDVTYSYVTYCII